MRVRKTQHPSIKQMESMTKNLKQKFGYGVIFANIYAHEDPHKPHIDYWLSTPEYGKTITMWETLQSEYFRLMKEA